MKISFQKQKLTWSTMITPITRIVDVYQTPNTNKRNILLYVKQTILIIILPLHTLNAVWFY
nr:MAG TPA: hypothetical protein [Caudoviricetes sp.]